MSNKFKNAASVKDYYTIDLLSVAKSLWSRAWVIVIAAFLAAFIGFVCAKFFIVPTYSSSVMLYVNNDSGSSSGGFSVSATQLSASQSLVETYTQILNNRTTLDRIAKAANVFYDYEDLAEMITASSAGGTEIMKVTVVSTDPYEAATIANCVAEILPMRIAEVITGATMEVVDSAIVNLSKVAPSVTRYTAVGMIIGIFMSTLVLVVMAIKDDTIHNDEYIMQTYEYPILAKIPDLLEDHTKNRGGYYYYAHKK